MRGHVTLRYIRQSIRLYVVDDHVDIVTEEGELVGEITLNPDRDYQPIKRNAPIYNARVLASTMSRLIYLVSEG